jgi:mono/diheme cytochrome c family protein
MLNRKSLTVPVVVAIAGLFSACSSDSNNSNDTVNGADTEFDPQRTFRFDTFGDEAFWTDILRWNEVVATISPITALSVGLKVDAEVLPEGLLDTADLNDPATTVELLRLDAVLGVKATVEIDGTVSQFGITCALCHSTVDDSVAPGIGKRLDGWPARDLDAGKIISLSPFFDDKPGQRAIYESWGAGKFDDYYNIDGINSPVVNAPAYGLKNVALETFTGIGPISTWNSYVAITQMGGQGNLHYDLLGLDIEVDEDMVTPKLPALLAYQESLLPPVPPVGSFNDVAAARGKLIFEGKATCAGCHSGEFFTDAPTLHEPSETGSDPLHAMRSGTGKYRTTPLKGIWQHPPYFHNGAHATLADVVDHYDTVLAIGLLDEEKTDLVEYLKSL